VKNNSSLVDRYIHNQYDSSITSFYPDFKLNSPSYINVNSPLNGSSNNFKVYIQNTRGLKEKKCQLSNTLYFEPSHLLCITEHHLKDLETDIMPIEYYKLCAKFCIHQHKNGDIYAPNQ
jgi:hypothetical protein